MLVPDVGRFFNNTFKTTLTPQALVSEIERMSTNVAEYIPDEKNFVVENREGNSFKLLSAEYLRKHPNGKMCPVMDVKVDDYTEGEGALINFNLDLQKTPVAVTSLVLMTIIFIGTAIWFVCEAFTYKDVPSTIISGILVVVSATFIIVKALIPVFKMLVVFNKAVLAKERESIA